PALVEFLERGDRPVVITFGSMVHTDPHETLRTLVAAVRRAGCRAIIQRSWEAMPDMKSTPDIFQTGFVNHAWLFPQAALIVHHGGGGTAAAVFRSGIPSVFVPHGDFYDQRYWATLAQEIGCAGAPIPIGELS